MSANSRRSNADSELAWQVGGGGFSRAAYTKAGLELLQRVIPTDTTTWNAIDVTTGWTEVYGTTGGAGWGAEAAQQLAHVTADHPMIESYFASKTRHSATPRRMSDITTRADLLRTRAYHELLHPFGAEYQLTIVTALLGPTEETRASIGRCWTFNRSGRDFTEDERDFAEHINRRSSL